MSTSSMQACMETASDWLKGIVPEDRVGMDYSSSSPSAGDQLIPCSRPPPVMDRRLRPPHDQALKCPRCDSTHTKFCYYNNYSLSQPRYFCKTCRRYWTKGGSLRNVPVGGGCRKNKRSATKKPADQILHHHHHPPQPLSSFHGGTAATDLHLSFSGMQLPPHLDSLPETPRGLNFIDFKYNAMLESSPNGLELMESKFGAMVGGSSRSRMFMSSTGNEVISHGYNNGGSFGFSVDGTFAEAYHRLASPFGGHEEDPNAVDVKPAGNRVLSLEWQDQGCVDVGSCGGVGYSGGLGFWAGGLINGHGPSAAI